MIRHKNKIIIGGVTAVLLAIAFFSGDGGGGVTSGDIRDGSEVLHMSGDSLSIDGGINNIEGDQSYIVPGFESAGEKPEETVPAEHTDGGADSAIRNPELNGEKSGTAVSGTEARGDSNTDARNPQPSQNEPGVTTEISETEGALDTAGEDSLVIDASLEAGELSVTLIISVASVLNNMEKLPDGKAELVPQNGIVFSSSVVFYEGESVFNVLQREVRRNRIHMESVNTPIYNSAYVKGINNIYEFDLGESSGWMYSVNGIFPNYGSSRYILSDGDVIKWSYTCDRGADIGGADVSDYYGFG